MGNSFKLATKSHGDKVEAETMSFGTYVKGIDGLMAGLQVAGCMM